MTGVCLLLPAVLSAPVPAAPAAGGECLSEWALSTRGIAIGSANDRVKVGADGTVAVFSDFHPNSLLAMFGVDPATREFLTDDQGRARQRTETRGGSKPETNLWRRQDDGDWERSINGSVDKHQSAATVMVIDSTSFPYLLHLGLLPAVAGSQAVAVLSKGKIYPATLQVRAVSKASDAFEVDFSSADGQGRAVLARDLRPLRIEFTDEHGTLRGQLRQWQCR